MSNDDFLMLHKHKQSIVNSEKYYENTKEIIPTYNTTTTKPSASYSVSQYIAPPERRDLDCHLGERILKLNEEILLRQAEIESIKSVRSNPVLQSRDVVNGPVAVALQALNNVEDSVRNLRSFLENVVIRHDFVVNVGDEFHQSVI